MKKRIDWGAAALLLLLAGCGPKQARVGALPPKAANVPRPPEAFLDLEAGWRLRAVMGLRKDAAGAVIVGNPQIAAEEQKGLSVTLRAADLVGYETDYYGVEAGKRGQVAVKFASGERMENGQGKAVGEPGARLFGIPVGMGQVRLLYLLEASAKNHSMAVLAAGRREDLEELTRRVQAAPEEACRREGKAYCEWIPAGVAVRAERQRQGGEWEAVR